MVALRPFLVGLLCAVLVLAGAPLRAGCGTDAQCAAASCCCGGEGGDVQRACSCCDGDREPEPAAPAPPDLPLGLVLEVRDGEPVGKVVAAPGPIRTTTASELPPGPLPGRSRQVALSVWQP